MTYQRTRECGRRRDDRSYCLGQDRRASDHRGVGRRSRHGWNPWRYLRAGGSGKGGDAKQRAAWISTIRSTVRWLSGVSVGLSGSGARERSGGQADDGAAPDRRSSGRGRGMWSRGHLGNRSVPDHRLPEGRRWERSSANGTNRLLRGDLGAAARTEPHSILGTIAVRLRLTQPGTGLARLGNRPRVGDRGLQGLCPIGASCPMGGRAP